MRKLTENDERAFLEAQLQWIRERDALLAQIEVKLDEMRFLALEILEKDLLPNEKLARQEQFDVLKQDIMNIEKLLQIRYN